MLVDSAVHMIVNPPGFISQFLHAVIDKIGLIALVAVLVKTEEKELVTEQTRI